MISCQGHDWYMSLHVHVLDCWILLPYLPGKQLLRLQLHSLFISSLCLIWLLQFTGCKANEHPCIVIVLFYLQNSLKSHIEESSYERFGVSWSHLVYRLISCHQDIVPESKYFTLQCFRVSLNSLFLMASLALFSDAFTSLLDIMRLSMKIKYRDGK